MSQGNILLLIGIAWPSIVNLALNLKDLIRDSIVVGVEDKKRWGHLQLDSFHTSEKAIAKSRQSEIVKSNKLSHREIHYRPNQLEKEQHVHAEDRDEKKQPKAKHKA